MKILEWLAEIPPIVAKIRRTVVNIGGYHDSNYRPVAKNKLHAGFEFEFQGNATHPAPAYYLKGIALPEHDGSVSVEYVTKPLPVENINKIQKLFDNVQKALDIAKKYKRNFGNRTIYVGGSCGTHCHLSVTSEKARKYIRQRTKRGSRIVYLLWYLQQNYSHFHSLFGRGFGGYRERYSGISDNQWENGTRLSEYSRYKWVNFTNNVTIEYRLPKFVNKHQYWKAFNACLVLHTEIINLLEEPLNSRHSKERVVEIAHNIMGAWEKIRNERSK